jgi:hypothetical protein
MADTSKEIRLPELRLKHILIEVVGTSPLIMNRFSEKAKQQMLGKQTKQASAGREAKKPKELYEASLHRLPDGKGYGFPAVGFKAAAVRAGTYADEKMTFLRGAFHVDGDLIPIIGEPSMREDTVRLQGRTADIRFRGQFVEWTATIPITYNATAISLEQVVNLFRIAGFAVGVGEWRPERNGGFGRFDVGDIHVDEEHAA